ncbi:ABC transporter substrate-binding protein [Clostridium oceanicum]|uniref:ABC transporter substrate-binding protein n=1 Tax=Clostridium oceanicum TaxID=1543 RepID=A0ABN1JFS1_9CLOT
MNKKLVSIISSIFLVTILFSGCKSKDVATNSKDKEVGKKQITLYMSGPQKMVDQLEKDFEKDKGDVLKIYHNGCGPIRQKILSEMEAGDIKADVVWAAEPLMYMDLQEKDKLLKYKSPETSNLKEEYKKVGNDYYTPVNARYGVVIYNKKLVSKENAPITFKDLTKPYFKGSIGIADLRQSSTALALTSGIYQINENNWDYYKKLKANDVMLTKQNVQVVEKVDSGEIKASIAPHDAALRLMKNAKKKNVKSNLAIAWPKEGSISIQRPISIIKNEKRSEENTKIAKEFVDFALSKKGQQISTKYGFITVRKDLELPKGVKAKVKSVTVDWEHAKKNQDKLKEEYNEIFSGK